MGDSAPTVPSERSSWQPERRNGRVEINANVYGPDGGRKSLTALSPSDYLRVWYEGRFDFQQEGRDRPEHLPTPQEVADFIEAEKQRPIPLSPPVVKIRQEEQAQRQHWRTRPSPRELRKQDAVEPLETKQSVARKSTPSAKPSLPARATFAPSGYKEKLSPEVRARLCPTVLRQYESNIFTVKEATKLSRYGHDLQIKYANQLIRGQISIEELR